MKKKKRNYIIEITSRQTLKNMTNSTKNTIVDKMMNIDVDKMYRQNKANMLIKN